MGGVSGASVSIISGSVVISLSPPSQDEKTISAARRSERRRVAFFIEFSSRKGFSIMVSYLWLKFNSRM
jgi:hypothetical protein